MSERNENRGLGLSGKTILAILAIISLVPYRYLPKILQDVENVLESTNPFKRLHDFFTSMTEEEALEELNPGDHIYCYRGTFFSHHGIYAGEGKVWEYDGKTMSDAEIKLSPLSVFSRGDKVNRLNYDADFSAEEILQRAASRKFEAEYNVISNNCMHFAFWCRLASEESAKATEEVFTLLLNEGKNSMAAGVPALEEGK